MWLNMPKKISMASSVGTKIDLVYAFETMASRPRLS